MTFAVRQAHPSDMPRLYRICLETGDSGGDATPLVHDPDLLGHLYLGPYLTREPDSAFVLTRDHKPCGYIVGIPDTAAFNYWTEHHWLTVLRQQYDLEAADSARSEFEKGLYASLHRPPAAPDISRTHPAHLHINLTPAAQGGGGGRALVERLLTHFTGASIPGIHLRMSARNTGALRFYERLGFTLESEDPDSLTLIRTLTPSGNARHGGEV